MVNSSVFTTFHDHCLRFPFNLIDSHLEKRSIPTSTHNPIYYYCHETVDVLIKMNKF